MQDVHGQKAIWISYVFNHEDIDFLYYLGMQDIEEFNFRFKLDEAIEKIESEGYKHAKSKCKPNTEQYRRLERKIKCKF